MNNKWPAYVLDFLVHNNSRKLCGKRHMLHRGAVHVFRQSISQISFPQSIYILLNTCSTRHFYLYTNSRSSAVLLQYHFPINSQSLMLKINYSTMISMTNASEYSRFKYSKQFKRSTYTGSTIYKISRYYTNNHKIHAGWEV
jgi:hypothetical protein